jgi:hypothetical protein
MSRTVPTLPIAEFDFALTLLDGRSLHVHMRNGKTSVYGKRDYVPDAELETLQQAGNGFLVAAVAFLDVCDGSLVG